MPPYRKASVVGSRWATSYNQLFQNFEHRYEMQYTYSGLIFGGNLVDNVIRGCIDGTPSRLMR